MLATAAAVVARRTDLFMSVVGQQEQSQSLHMCAFFCGALFCRKEAASFPRPLLAWACDLMWRVHDKYHTLSVSATSRLVL